MSLACWPGHCLAGQLGLTFRSEYFRLTRDGPQRGAGPRQSGRALAYSSAEAHCLTVWLRGDVIGDHFLVPCIGAPRVGSGYPPTKEVAMHRPALEATHASLQSLPARTSSSLKIALHRALQKIE